MHRDRAKEREVLGHFESLLAATQEDRKVPRAQRLKELDAMIEGCKKRIVEARDSLARNEPELWRLVKIRTQIQMECPACVMIELEGGYTSTLGVIHTYRGGCKHAESVPGEFGPDDL